VRTIPKEAQCREGSLNARVASDESTLDANGISGQGKSGGAMLHGAPGVCCPAPDHCLDSFLQEIVKGKALERLKLLVRKGVLSRLPEGMICK